MATGKTKRRLFAGFFLLAGAVLGLGAWVSATTILVDDSFGADDPAAHNWTSVQEGIYDAAPGDTVYVYDGYYVENVTMWNASVTLEGQSRDGVVIDRQSGAPVAVIDVRAAFVIIRNLTLTHGDYGVRTTTTAHNNGTIDNLTIYEINYDCIEINAASSWTIHDTSLSSCGYGAIAFPSGTANSQHYVFNIAMATLTNYDGIYLYAVSYSRFENFTVQDPGRNGIYTYSSYENTFNGFSINSSASYGVYMYNADNTRFLNGSITNKTGGVQAFYAYISDYGMLDNITIASNAGGGIYLQASSYWRWRSVNNTNVAEPVEIYYTSPIVLSNFQHDIDTSNTILGLPVVYFSNASGATYNGSAGWFAAVNSTSLNITLNTTISTLWHGVLVLRTNGSTFTDFNSSGNAWNFVIEGSHNNTFANTRMSSVRASGGAGGIWLHSSTYNLFSGGLWQTPARSYVAMRFQASSGANNNTVENVTCLTWNYCFDIDTDISDVTLYNMTVGDSNYGVYSYYANSFTIEWSRFVSNFYYGIYISSNTGQLIDRVMVRNNTFNHTTYYSHIYVGYSLSGTIENNTFNDSDYNVYAYQSRNLVIRDNLVNYSRTCGLRGDYSDYLQVTNNTFLYGPCAIEWYYSSYWTLRSNEVPNMTRAFRHYVTAASSTSWFVHDMDDSNMLNGYPVLYVINATSGSFGGAYSWIAVANSSNVTVYSTVNVTRNDQGLFSFRMNDSVVEFTNFTANWWGMTLYASDRNTIRDVNVSSNTAGGVYVWQSDWNLFLRDRLRPDTLRGDYGFDFEDTSNNNTMEQLDCIQFSSCIQMAYLTNFMSVLNSTLNDSYYGVYSAGQFGPRVEGNVFNYSYYQPVILQYSTSRPTTQFRIANNTFNGTNYQGVYCYACLGGSIEDNSFRSSQVAIYLYQSDAVLMARNSVVQQSSYGFQSEYSDFNVAVDNFFDLGGASNAAFYFSYSRFWTLRGNNVSNQSLPVSWSFPVPMANFEYAMHDADATNLANGYPWRWWVNATGVSFNGTAGLVILTNSTAMNVTVSNPVSWGAAGISLVGTTGSTFFETNLSRNYYGVVTYHSHNNTFLDLTVWRNTNGGVYLSYSDWNRFLGGVYTPDTAYADSAVHILAGSRNNTISINETNFSSGVLIDNSAYDNRIDGGSYNLNYYGVQSNSYIGTRVERASFADNYYYHVYQYGGGPATSFNVFSNNTMHRSPNYDGVYVYNVGGGVIADNLINMTGSDGVYLQSVTGVTVARNLFTNGSGYALNGYSSSSLFIVDNVVTQSRYGLYLYDSRYWTFVNNSFSNFTGTTPWAVYFNSADPVTDATVFMHYWTPDNTIEGLPVRYYVNATGVTFFGSAGWLVAVNCTFMDLGSTSLNTRNYYGALFVKVFNSTLRGYASNASYYGAALMWGADNRLENVSVNASYRGIYLSNNTRATINGVYVSNATNIGLYPYLSTRLNITNSTFYRNYYGVYLEYRSQFVNITNNTFEANTYSAIYTEGTDDVRIVRNTVQGSLYYGIFVQATSGDHADRHFMIENRINTTGYYDGIRADYMYGGLVDANNVTGSGEAAILLYLSNGNLVRRNTFRFQYYAFLIYGDSNQFVDNVVSSSTITIYMASGGDFNKFYHNNFFTNNTSFVDLGTSNTYDNGYPSGGNYWSNTTHTDLYTGAAQTTTGSDGINDTAANLPYGRRDNYPLSQPWPPYAVLFGPANGSVIQAGVTIDFNVSFYFNTVQYALNNGTTSNFTSPFDISTSGMPDGDLFVQLWANDTWYNLTPSFLFTIDSTAPTISADGPAPSGTYLVGTQLNFTVSDAHLAANVTRNNGSGPVTFADPWDIDTTGWAEADYNITITAWDTAGNSRTSVFVFKLDSTAPSITLVSPANGSFIAVGTLIDLAVFDVHLSGVTWDNGSGSNSLASPFDIPTSGWASGTYNITVVATDTGGLSTMRLYTYTIDATPPLITLVAPANNTVFEPGQVIDLDVTDSNLVGVTWDDGSGPQALASPYDLDTTAWADGAYDITVRANDTAGNVAVSDFHFEVDSLAPVVGVNTPANNTFISAGTPLDFSVTDPHLTSATWTSGSGDTLFSSPFDISTTGWADGTWVIRVNATDSLGHTSSANLTIMIDSVLPTVTLVSPANGSYIVAGTPIDLTVSDTNLDLVDWTTGAAPAALGSPFDISTTGWVDGVYTVRVNATDLAGNLRFASFTFTVDSTAPAVSLNSPGNGSYFPAGTTIDLSVVETNLNAADWTIGGAPTAFSSPFDIATTGWADGPYTVRVNVTDLAGNARFASFTFTVDSTPPALALVSPANGSYIVAGTTIDLSASDTNLNLVDWTTSGAPTTLASPFDISTTGWSDGLYTVRVNATDLAGNLRFASYIFTVDSTAPTVTLTSPANGSYFPAGTTIDLAVADTNLNAADWTLGGAPTAFSSPFDISTTGWADGPYTVRVNATDLAGNRRFASFTFTVDSTPPTLTLTSPSNGSYIVAGTTIDLSVSDTNLDLVDWTTAGAPTGLLSPFDISTTGWADGSYTVRVNATDLAGNLRFGSFLFILDSTPPTVTLTSPASGSVVVAGTTLDLAVSDANMNSVTWTTGGAPTTLASPYDISTTGWADGAYTLRVNATDLAGNLRSANFTVTLDSTPPSVALNSPANGSAFRAGTTIDLSVSDTNFDAANWTTAGAPTTFASPFDISTTGWADGAYTVRVNATDLAGNLAYRSYSFVLDSTPPTVALNSPSAGAVVRAGTTIDLAVADTNLGTVTWSDGSTTTPLASPFDISTTGWADGPFSISVFADDAAGNPAWLNFTVTIDSTGPSIALLSPANGSVIRAGTVLSWNISDANLQNASYNNGTADLGLGAPFQVSTAGYIDRNYNFTLFASDAAGNLASARFNFTIDSTPPQLLLLSPTNGSWVREGVTIDFGISDLHLSFLDARLDGSPITLDPGFDYASNNLSDGNHTFMIVAADEAGNSRSLNATFRVDKTAPTITWTPVDGAIVRMGTGWSVGITEANLRIAQWRNESDIVWTDLPASHIIDTTGWPDGFVKVFVQVDDFASHLVIQNSSLTIDSTPPSIEGYLAQFQPGYWQPSRLIDIVIANETSPYVIEVYVRGTLVALTSTGPDAFALDVSLEAEGQADIDIRVTDEAGNSAQVTVVLLFDGTPPSLASPLPMAYGGNEDSAFGFHASAIDGIALASELSYVWAFNDSRVLSEVILTGSDATWTFTTPGQYEVNVSVSDPAGNLNNTTITITIFDITPPSLTLPVTSINTTEDTPVAITQSSLDNSNGTLNWTWRAPGANLTSFGPNITWVFETPGLYNISVTVTDPQNNSARGYVMVNVSDITGPEVSIVGPSVVDVFIPAVFTANVTDNDPRFGPSSWTFQWLYDNGTEQRFRTGSSASFTDTEAGTVTVRLTVTDASGNVRSANHILIVNAPPIVDSQPPTEVTSNGSWVWQVNATDPEGNATNITLVNGPPGMVVNPDGTITWTPPPGEGGTNQTVTVAISDGLSTVYRNFTLYVIDPALLAGNHLPVFDSEPPTDASVNKLYRYNITVHDEDNDPVVLTITGLDGYSYNPSTHILSWMPPWQPDVNERFERAVPVVITAFDGKQTAKQEFVIRFRNPPNIWPEFVSGLFGIGDVTPGQVIRVQVQGNWTDRDDFIANLTFVLNETDPDLRAQVGSVIRWHVEVVDFDHSVLVIEVIANRSTEVRFNMVARDPSGAKSENATVTVRVHADVQAPPPAAAFPWWMLLILAAGGAAGAAGLVVSLRRSRSATQVAQTALETAAKAPTERITERVIIQQGPGAAVPEARRDTYVIEGVFIIYGDGRLIYSKTDISEVKFEDPELVASMFSAVQSFIKDSFQQEGELNRLGMGENAIMIERGTSIYMAAIIYGEPQVDLTDAMKETIRTIENAYAGIIEEWDGSTTSLEAIDQYVEPFLAITATRTRADAKQAMTEKVVKMPSELEFFQGFVRLKCGVKNDTDTVITKVTVSIDFNEDVLRLHHIEPDSYKYQGSEVQLGVLNPGEKVSVAYYFDPQICTESQIDGVGRYRDAKGGVHSIAMKTRKAEVVCPIFFTKEHANTAMLKRLVESELKDMDSKVYNITAIPEGMKWSDIFGLVKEVVLGHDVHLVRDFIVEEPYHGEAWFYGETKVKGYKIVIRASVIEDGQKIEFFAASTQIRAITGLLAEFNHTLQSLIGRKYATLKVEPEFNEEVKQDIQKKSLMAKLGEGELEGGETEQDG